MDVAHLVRKPSVVSFLNSLMLAFTLSVVIAIHTLPGKIKQFLLAESKHTL